MDFSPDFPDCQESSTVDGCLISKIKLNLQAVEDHQIERNEVLDIGYRLRSCEEGHFVERKERINECPDLALCDGDRLLAIDQHSVNEWNHWIVLQALKYIFYTTETKKTVSLTINRQTRTGYDQTYLISITLERGCIPTGFLPRDIDTDGGILTEIRSMIKRIMYHPNIICVKFKDVIQCKIRHGSRTNCFLRVDDKEKLTVEPISEIEKDYYEFDCYTFNCLEKGVQRTDVDSIFIGAIRSCKKVQDHRPYITAKNCETIGLLSFKSFELDLDKSNLADPRFFKFIKTSNGDYLFESLIYENYYITWQGRKLKMEKHSFNEISLPATYLNGCKFEMIPMAKGAAASC